MNKRIAIIQILAVLVIVILCFSACSTNNEIEGIWYEKNGVVLMDFDNKCTFVSYVPTERYDIKEFDYKYDQNQITLSESNNDLVTFDVIYTDVDNKPSSIRYQSGDISLTFTREYVEGIRYIDLVRTIGKLTEFINPSDDDIDHQEELVEKIAIITDVMEQHNNFLTKLSMPIDGE